MHAGRGRFSGVIACAFAGLAIAVPAGAAASSSGEITRAQVSPDWTTAGIAGSASSACPTLPEPKLPPEPEPPWEEEPVPEPWVSDWACSWTVFATVGPGASLGDCESSGRRLGSLGAGVQLLWMSPPASTSGHADFDLYPVALQHGASSPLLCLSAREAVPVEGPCLPKGKCFYESAEVTRPLDFVLLAPPTTAQPQTSPAPSRAPCKKRRQRLRRSSKQGGPALGAGVRVKGKPKRVRRCKTG